jgi:hypothetical protein
MIIKKKITIIQYKFDGKWITKIKDIPSGLKIHANSDDSISIEFAHDAKRFEPIIKVQ